MEKKIKVVKGNGNLENKEKVIEILMTAFNKKFSSVIKNEEKLRKLMKKYINFENAFYCYYEGEIVGVLGFESKNKKFDKINFWTLLFEIGIIKMIKTILLYAPFSRKLKENEIRIIAIAVDENKRGLGIGTHLLQKFYNYSREEKFQKILLEVVDTNPKAKKLYKEHNFKDSNYIKLDSRHKAAGFNGVYFMEKNL